MTITVGWVRQNRGSSELVIASDSRLRSRGALDQAQKIFRLHRGDCCLGFCGDAQIAYPFFIQVISTLENFVKTRTRAVDVTQLSRLIGQILNNLVTAWNLTPSEKEEELAGTRLLFGGWSWLYGRFDIGVFSYTEGKFERSHPLMKLFHPWIQKSKSLVFIGDYESEFREELRSVLQRSHPVSEDRTRRIYFDFNYEPLTALNGLLSRGDARLSSIGGAPQVAKIYRFGNSLPIVVRHSQTEHYLLGRKLFDWEKTEYPIMDMDFDPPRMIYPISHLPVPRLLQHAADDDAAPEEQMVDQDQK